MQGGDYRLGRRAALDALRGVAVTLVLLAHAVVPHTGSAGMVGVTLFFVLSGFLITRLLVEEGEGFGTVNLRAFYARRARRLLPALLGFLAAVVAVSGGGRVQLLRALVAATYTTNIVGVQFDMGALGHTWSLALEEQFYLLWPLALIWVRRRRRSWLAPALVVTIVAVSVHRVMLMLDGASRERVLIAPDTRVDALLLGCLTALMVQRLARFNLALPAAAGAAVMAVVIPAPESTEGIGLIPVMVGAAALVAWGATLNWSAVGASSLVVGLGRISYGVYLWHYPVTMVLGVAGVPWWANLLVTFAFSITVASASWRWVERPIIERWRPPRPIAAHAVWHDEIAPAHRVVR